MSAKTKIVVVKMKHVILTGVLLGILLLLIIFAAHISFQVMSQSLQSKKPACIHRVCTIHL